MKVRLLIKLIQDDGWYLVRTRGSHRQFIVDPKNKYTLLAQAR